MVGKELYWTQEDPFKYCKKILKILNTLAYTGKITSNFLN